MLGIVEMLGCEDIDIAMVELRKYCEMAVLYYVLLG